MFRVFSHATCRPVQVLFVAGCFFLGPTGIPPVQAQTREQTREATRLNNNAVALSNIGKGREALALYNQALALNPKDDVILYNRAVTYTELGMDAKAMQDADELLGRHPLNTHYLSLRGTIHFRFHRDDKGREDYRKAVSLEPENVELLEKYIRRLRDSGDYPEYLFQRLRYLGLKGTPTEAGPADAFPLGTSAKARQNLLPQAGEIRLHGRVAAVDAQRRTISVEVAGFGNSNGGFRALDAPKLKTVRAGAVEIVYNEWITLPVAALRPDDFLILLGKDQASGFAPRRTFLVRRVGSTARDLVRRFNGEKYGEIEAAFPGKDLSGIAEAAVLAPGEDDHRPAVFIGRDEKGPVLFAALGSFTEWPMHTTEPPESMTPDLRLLDFARKTAGTVEWDRHGKPARLQVTSRHVGLGAAADHELLALRLASAPSSMPFAKKRPAVGEIVWVIGDYGGAFVDVASVVLWSDSQRLILRGTAGDEDGRQPGSVVLNKDGEVVGQTIDVDDDLTVAAPVDTFRRVLATAPVK